MKTRIIIPVIITVATLLSCGCASLTRPTKINTGHTTPQKAVKPISGQCHCGHIKYEARGSIVKSSYCDCHGCQRATGCLKAPFVTVSSAQFKLIAGKVAEFRAASGEKCDCHGVWHFCPKCGTQVFWKSDKGKQIDIFAGTLDDTTMFQPDQ